MATPAIAPVEPSPAEEKWTPTVYIDLTKSDVDELKGLEPGQKVKVTIEGTLRSLSKHAERKSKTGSLAVETKDVKVRKMDNTFEKLMDEDNEA